MTVKFVIRSMSTTDAGPGGDPEPYHIYLLPPEKRHGVYWSRHVSSAMTFDTGEEALWEINRLKLDSAEIAPTNADEIGMLNYWETHK